MIAPPNQGLEGGARRRRRWVPVALRAPAPPQPCRWAARATEGGQ